MNNGLSASDLSLIQKNMSESIDRHLDVLKDYMDSRVNMTEELLSESIRGLQQINEINHNSLKRAISEVEIVANETKSQALETNGRVLSLERKVDGEKDSNGNIVGDNQGLINDIKEIKKYRFLYKNPSTLVGLFVIMCLMFIKESRDFILDNFFNFIK